MNLTWGVYLATWTSQNGSATSTSETSCRFNLSKWMMCSAFKETRISYHVSHLWRRSQFCQPLISVCQLRFGSFYNSMKTHRIRLKRKSLKVNSGTASHLNFRVHSCQVTAHLSTTSYSVIRSIMLRQVIQYLREKLMMIIWLWLNLRKALTVTSFSLSSGSSIIWTLLSLQLKFHQPPNWLISC